MINNAKLLHLDDKFLKGTGKLKDFESSVVDTYLHKDVRERLHFEFISEEMWLFLKQRYDCDYEIKRFYSKAGSYSYTTEVEARFKKLPIFFVRADMLYREVTEDAFVVKSLQIPAKKSFSDLKKRLVDVLEAQGMPNLKTESIRMWLASDKTSLMQSF